MVVDPIISVNSYSKMAYLISFLVNVNGILLSLNHVNSKRRLRFHIFLPFHSDDINDIIPDFSADFNEVVFISELFYNHLNLSY